MNMLEEGTKTRTSLQINDEWRCSAPNSGTGSDLDTSSVALSASQEEPG